MIIGITGNSGCGKSSLSQILKDCYGAYIIDADAVAHKVLLKDGPAYAEVTAAFGGGILGADGEIERKRLGKIVFNDEARREQLMAITHRYIIREMLLTLEQARERYPHVVLDAPLLIEAGLHKSADAVWVVWADDATRLARITARDKITPEQAKARMGSQTAFDVLKKYANVVIDNNGGIALLKAQAEAALSAAV